MTIGWVMFAAAVVVVVVDKVVLVLDEQDHEGSNEE